MLAIDYKSCTIRSEIYIGPFLLQGVPINMGIKLQLLYRFCFQWDYFVKNYFVVSELKHLPPKTICGLKFFHLQIDGDIRKVIESL